MKFWSCLICILIEIQWGQWAQAGPLKIVADHSPPFQVAVGERLVGGFSTELVKHLLERTHLAYTLEVFPWARAYKLALNQKNTVVISMVRCRDRAPLFKWVGPLYKGIPDQYLWSLSHRENMTVTSLKGAQKYSVAVTRSKLSCLFLRKKGFEVSNTLFPVVNDIQALKMLYRGRVDLMAGSKKSVLDAVESLNKGRYPLSVQLKQVLLLPKIGHGVYMAFNREVDDSIVAGFQTELDRFKKDEGYERLCRKWFTQREIGIKQARQESAGLVLF